MPCYTRVKVTMELDGNLNIDRLSKTLQDLGFILREYNGIKKFAKYGMEIQIDQDGKISLSSYDADKLETAKGEIKRAYTRTTVLENAKRYGFRVSEDQKTGKLTVYK